MIKRNVTFGLTFILLIALIVGVVWGTQEFLLWPFLNFIISAENPFEMLLAVAGTITLFWTTFQSLVWSARQIDSAIFGDDWQQKSEFNKELDDYLAWVIEHHSPTRLHGLLDVQKAGQTQHLGTIYTSLQVNHHARFEANENEAGLRGPQDLFGRQNRKHEVDMADLLTLQERVAIIGGAGSGKTTYLDFVAITLAKALRGEKLDVRLKPPDAKGRLPVPFVVPLRFWNVYRDYCAKQVQQSLVDEEHNKLKGFLLWYLERHCHQDLEGFFDQVLEKHDVLLMFDGLDEVVEVLERRVVRNELNNLLTQPRYHNPRCLITAREAGYKDAPFGNDFLRCDIQPMDKEQIERLVNRWCDHLPAMEANARPEIIEIITQMNQKRQARQQEPVIATPLMVTMVVSVRYSQRKLPQERAKLYDKVVDLILTKEYGRDADAENAWQKLITWGGEPNKRREWLSHLAFHMHKQGNGGAVADEGTVRTLLSKALQTRGEEASVEPFIQAMRRGGGLFEERGEQFQFMHLSFQEFLAAQYLATQWREHSQELAAWVTDSWWRETLLLTIGSLDSPSPFPHREAFLNALLQLDGCNEAKIAAVELAVRGILELSKAEPVLVQRAHHPLIDLFSDEKQELLHDISPPLRAKAGIALAQIGDPRPNVMTVEGMEFCYVPAGPFWMGSDDGEDDAKPLHQVDIPYGYWMGRYPVSNAQFEEFVQAGGYGVARFWTEAKAHGWWIDGQIKDWRDQKLYRRPRNYGSPYNLPNHPVVGITWYEALAFMRWLAEKWGSEVRLPKEREWEKAARGGLQIPVTPLIRPASHLNGTSSLPSLSIEANPLPQRHYPWGNDADPTRANYDESHIGHPNAMGGFPKGESPYGSQEMSGNVWEWAQSLYVKYEDSPKDEHERLDVYGPRVVRGGLYYENKHQIICDSRGQLNPYVWYYGLGFRVFRACKGDEAN